MVDKDKKTITIYSGRQKILETISVPEEYLSLPPSTWDAGDEVRIYYKEEGKALRFMNISTDGHIQEVAPRRLRSVARTGRSRLHRRGMRRAVMENSEEVKGPEMNTRNWLLVIVVDVLILVELGAAMYVASVHPDDFEAMFMKSFFRHAHSDPGACPFWPNAAAPGAGAGLVSVARSAAVAFIESSNEAEQAMAKDGPTEIYMIKKSADGFIVSFRLGTDQGVTPGMDLVVLNEDGFQVGHVTVLSSTETKNPKPWSRAKAGSNWAAGSACRPRPGESERQENRPCHPFRRRLPPHRAVFSACVSPHGSRL